MPASVVHFEMPYDDRDRMSDFYAKTFGWVPNRLGPEMGSYVVVHTGATDAVTHRPTEVGRINGGLYDRTMSKTQHGTNVVLGTDDIRRDIAAIKANGGEVLTEPVMIPGQGEYVMF